MAAAPQTIPQIVDPTILYRATGPRHLGAFIHQLYNLQPHLAPHVKTIVLDADLDSAENSFVLELLYYKNWDPPTSVPVNSSTSSLPATTPHQHPFSTLLSSLYNSTSATSAKTARKAPLTVYLDIVARLLEICVNLDAIYIPRAWLGFNTQAWRKLRIVGLTEEMDVLRQRRDSGVKL